MKKYISIGFLVTFLFGFGIGLFFEIKKMSPRESLNKSALHYGSCEYCGDKWNWKEGKTIWYKEDVGMFPLCRECFNNLTYPYVLWYYLKHLEDYCENTDEQIQKIATQIGIEKVGIIWSLSWIKEKLYKNGKLIKITETKP